MILIFHHVLAAILENYRCKVFRIPPVFRTPTFHKFTDGVNFPYLKPCKVTNGEAKLVGMLKSDFNWQVLISDVPRSPPSVT